MSLEKKKSLKEASLDLQKSLNILVNKNVYFDIDMHTCF